MSNTNPILITASDYQRATTLRRICAIVGVDYERGTADDLVEKIALNSEYADRYEGLLR